MYQFHCVFPLRIYIFTEYQMEILLFLTNRFKLYCESGEFILRHVKCETKQNDDDGVYVKSACLVEFNNTVKSMWICNVRITCYFPWKTLRFDCVSLNTFPFLRFNVNDSFSWRSFSSSASIFHWSGQTPKHVKWVYYAWNFPMFGYYIFININNWNEAQS